MPVPPPGAVFNPNETVVSPKKLSAEDVERAVARLTRRIEPPRLNDQVELSPRIVRDPEEIARNVDRLYRQGMELKRRAYEEAQMHTQTKDQPPTIVRSAADLEEGITRLYTDAMAVKVSNEKRAKEALRAKQHTVKSTMSIDDMNARLYVESRKQQQEAKEKLWKKYVEPTEVKCRKMTQEELKASTARLTTKS